METVDKPTISDATAAHTSLDSSLDRSSNHLHDRKAPSPPARSPAHSPAPSSVYSDLSHQSSLSHGSSPKEEKLAASPPGNVPDQDPPPMAAVNRSVWEEPKAVTRVDPVAGSAFLGGVLEQGGRGGRRLRPSLSILRRTKRETMVKKSALGFRVFGLLFCLISFSVMAADRNQGWALDSFDRYMEFRYNMSVNVIGFVYSSAQASDLAYHLATGKYVVRHQLRYYFDFAIDQMVSYLLISASSSAATRVDDWQSNWGHDKFPDMATASVAMSFLAFVALASSSLISGYSLCTSDST